MAEANFKIIGMDGSVSLSYVGERDWDTECHNILANIPHDENRFNTVNDVDFVADEFCRLDGIEDNLYFAGPCAFVVRLAEWKWQIEYLNADGSIATTDEILTGLC